MSNNTPFGPVGVNQTMLCPADLINPWRVARDHGAPGVQEVPESGLKNLMQAKRTMTVKQQRMQEILWEDTRNEMKRYMPGKLKLGKNKSNPHVEAGGFIMAELGGKPPC